MINLIGQKFGRLTVIKRTNNAKDGHARWLCKCNCGKTTIAISNDLKKGTTKSCGCLQKEISIKINTKHGHIKNKKWSTTYQSWHSMKQRCYNSSTNGYHNYGGRGITVCERWLKFENFLEDMGETPEGYQIDRIDNNKGYYKENCRWVTPQEQARNRHNNHLETYNEKTQCLVLWAEEYNIPCDTLLSRLNRLNWSIKKALTTPVRIYNKTEIKQ